MRVIQRSGPGMRTLLPVVLAGWFLLFPSARTLSQEADAIPARLDAVCEGETPAGGAEVLGEEHRSRGSKGPESPVAPAPASSRTRTPRPPEPFHLVNGGRWDIETILRRLAEPPPPRTIEGTPAVWRPHDSGANIAVAAACLGGRAGLRALLQDLRGQALRGLTFREPGVDGRVSSAVACEQIDRWLAHLEADRMNYADLFRLVRWMRTFYADPEFLTPAAQMRLYLTLGGRPYRSVDRVPDSGRELWDFVGRGLSAGEYLVAGVDANGDREVDRWLLMGRDRRGRAFAFGPAGGSDGMPILQFRVDGNPGDLMGTLRALGIASERDTDNPAHFIGRRVYRIPLARD